MFAASIGFLASCAVVGRRERIGRPPIDHASLGKKMDYANVSVEGATKIALEIAKLLPKA